MLRDLFLFVCNIEKLIVRCIYAKIIYYNLTKNSRKFQASVTERCSSFSTHSGIFQQNLLKNACEKVESLKILYCTCFFHLFTNALIYRSLLVSYITHIFVFIFVKGITSRFYNSWDGKRKKNQSYFWITFATWFDQFI